MRKDTIALAKNNGYEDNNKTRNCRALYYFQNMLSFDSHINHAYIKMAGIFSI